jgi:hypothetical protein
MGLRVHLRYALQPMLFGQTLRKSNPMRVATGAKRNGRRTRGSILKPLKLFERPVDLVLANTLKPRLREPILRDTVHAQGL